MDLGKDGLYLRNGVWGGWSVLVAKFAATDLILKKRFVNKPFRNKIIRPVPVSL